jgi:hypothetical protein
VSNFWEDDLSIFYSSNTPGCVQVTFGTSIIWVQWFNEYEAAAMLGIAVETRHPYLRAKDSDITGITHSSTFIKNGVTYKVIEVMPDGTGETVVELSKD